MSFSSCYRCIMSPCVSLTILSCSDGIALRRISMFWVCDVDIHVMHCVLCTRSGTSNDGYTNNNKNMLFTLSCISRWRVLAISSNSMWRAFDFRRRKSHAVAFHVYVWRNLCVYLLIGFSIATKTTEDSRVPSNYASERSSPALSRHPSPLIVRLFACYSDLVKWCVHRFRSTISGHISATHLCVLVLFSVQKYRYLYCRLQMIQQQKQKQN